MKSIIALLLISLVATYPAHAKTASRCKVDSILRLLSADISSYEKVKGRSLGQSSEGADITYYYARDRLKAVKSLYFGETSKAEIEYRFRSPTEYAVHFTEYFYTAPIYIDNSEIASTSESKFVVCGGELIRGIGDDVVVRHYKRAVVALKEMLDDVGKTPNKE